MSHFIARRTNSEPEAVRRPLLIPHVEHACRRIAPLWPLDSFVAVNPYQGLSDMPFATAGEYLADTVGERLFMDRRWFAEQFEAGHIRTKDLATAASQLGVDCTVPFLLGQMHKPPAPSLPMPLLANTLDRPGAPPVSEFVVEQISRFLASYYDQGQALWQRPQHGVPGLYAAWRQYTLIDRSAKAVGLARAHARLSDVPSDAEAAIVWAVDTLALPDDTMPEMLFALLKSIGGWAGWCRYRLWQAELAGESCTDLHELLAIRLVWEGILLCKATPTQQRRWRDEIHQWGLQPRRSIAVSGLVDEAFLTAAEIAFRHELIGSLARGKPPGHDQAPLPRVQAAFCIDVRSEVFRRHLEMSMPGLQTIGFAGFFGVPLEYRRIGEQTARTHTPVLLNPLFEAREQGSPQIAAKRSARLGRSAAWKHFKLSAASCFTFVEAAGLSYVPRLIADTLGWHRPSVAPDTAGLIDSERRRMEPALAVASGELSLNERADLAESILRGLGLTQQWAEVVLLVGHGSSTTNNPHRAGLDCGACAGQTGEVSARVAVQLLNDSEIRTELARRGLNVRAETRFAAALHDTTTDGMELLDIDSDEHNPGLLNELRTALQHAGELTRLERLVALDPTVSGAHAAERHVIRRSCDWSQVRPEWGLAGNAAFIAAPRWRTRDAALGGRVFLHDYDTSQDTDFAVLKLIMTAPLIVANWINLQYYGSTVDNRHQGSGNKVLHNVVGGLVGVLEGNGSDLRVGLSEQSLRTSEGLRHEPLRLSAFIEAPADIMDEIIEGHDILWNLVENRWISILQISPEGSVRQRIGTGDWQPVRAD